MWDFYHKVSMWVRMEFIIDYTATPRKPDSREVEPFGQAPRHDYVAHENPLLCGMD